MVNVTTIIFNKFYTIMVQTWTIFEKMVNAFLKT